MISSASLARVFGAPPRSYGGGERPDPVAAREKEEKDQREKVEDNKRKATTLIEAAAATIAARNCREVTKTMWHQRLGKHVFPKLGNRPVSAITEDEIAEVLLPIWKTTPVMAGKLRNYLFAIFNFAMQKPRKWRDAKNPNPATLEALHGLLEEQNHILTQRAFLHYKEVHASCN
jgi:hypothetical protein